MQCGCSGGGDFLSQFKRPEPESSPTPKEKRVRTQEQKQAITVYAKQRRAKRISSGLCTSCGKEASSGGLECQDCKIKKRQQGKADYARKVAEKLTCEGVDVHSGTSPEEILQLAKDRRALVEEERKKTAALLPECNWSSVLCKERIAAGKCPYCGEYAALGRQLCNSCIESNRKTKERYVSSGLCRNCGKSKDTELKICSTCNEEQKASKRRFTKELKDKVFEGYGGYKCNCCGEDNPHFLQIDHVNNDGNKHRKKVGTGNAFYREIIEKGFPDCFQVLCSNCNWGKRINGICPHKWECSKPKPEGGVNEDTGRTV